MTAPPPGVLEQFGLGADALRRLAGGQGTSWRSGDAVLKPVADPAAAGWAAEVSRRLPPDGFRLARPLPTRSGGWTADGWAAWSFLPGAPAADRWPDVLAVGAALNRALPGVARPLSLDRRTDAWAVADRVAWGEQRLPLRRRAVQELAARLRAHVRPTGERSQVVHGDLAGNVLFAPGLPPAVIDLSPYWRPPTYALAVVVADAIGWHGAPAGLVDALPSPGECRPMLARAALFRLVAADLLAVGDGDAPPRLAAEVAAARRVCAVLDGR